MSLSLFDEILDDPLSARDHFADEADELVAYLSVISPSEASRKAIEFNRRAREAGIPFHMHYDGGLWVCGDEAGDFPYDDIGIPVVKRLRFVTKNTSNAAPTMPGFTGERTDRLGRKYEWVNGRRVARSKPMQSPFTRKKREEAHHQFWADVVGGHRNRPLHEEPAMKQIAEIASKAGDQWEDLRFLGPLAPVARGLRFMMNIASGTAQIAVKGIAKEHGLEEKHVKRVADICGYIDLATSLTGLSGLPVGSIAYIVLSTARHPITTLRAAKRGVRNFLSEFHRVHSSEMGGLQMQKALDSTLIKALLERSQNVPDFDLWTACFMEAMDHTKGNVKQSIEIADGASKKGESVEKNLKGSKARVSKAKPKGMHSPFKQKRHEGEVWQGPSGKWFTLKNGRSVPAKDPSGKAKPAKNPKAAGDSPETHKTRIAKLYEDAGKWKPGTESKESHDLKTESVISTADINAAIGDPSFHALTMPHLREIARTVNVAPGGLAKAPLIEKIRYAILNKHGAKWRMEDAGMRVGGTTPTAKPKAPKVAATPSAVMPEGVKPWTTAQLVANLKKTSSRYDLLLTAQQTGWATDGRYAMKLHPDEHAKIPDSKDIKTPLTAEKIAAAIPSPTSMSDEPAHLTGAVRDSSEAKSKEKFVTLTDGVRSEEINAAYYAAIMKRYPDATAHLGIRADSGSVDDRKFPVVFRSGDKPIAVVVPLAKPGGDVLAKVQPPAAKPVVPNKEPKATHADGDTWQTGSRWYKQVGGKAARIPKPQVPEKPTEAVAVALAEDAQESFRDESTERKHAAMRAISEDVEGEWQKSRDLSPRGGMIALGSADFDHTLKATVGDGYLRAMRAGKTPDEALAAAKADGLDAIKKWNDHGHKGRATVTGNASYEYKRWEGAAETIADSFHRRFLMLSSLDSLPQTPAEEPKEAPSPVQPAKAEETPRETAARQTKEMDGDYEFARTSSIPNVGEDLKNSARHKRNLWKGLAEAEADGSAATMVHRETLLENEPADIGRNLDERPLTTLAMHIVLKKFPGKPGIRKNATPEQQATDRAQYVEAYRAIKGKAEEVAATQSDPIKAIEAVHDRVGKLIDQFRGVKGTDYMDRAFPPDRFNPTSNALVDLWKKTSDGYRDRQKKTSAVYESAMFLQKIKSKHPEATTASQIAELWKQYAGKVLEGMSVDKSLGSEKATAEKRGFNEMAMYLSKVKRKGGKNLDIADPIKAAAHLTNDIGLRGVQFGNSVSDEERRHHIRQAAEALADLTDILGIDPKDASLGGTLGLAIGARGHGTARAHYEPGDKNINLTRAGGVGTLAHEWGHAFDHSITGGKIVSDGAKRGGDYMSDHTSAKRFEKNPDGTWAKDEKGGMKTVDLSADPADPAWKAHDDLRTAWKTSGFQKRLVDGLRNMVQLGQMTKAKANHYWNSNIEKFARTFERYVQRKLHVAGRENTYLTGLADPGVATGLWPNDAEVDHMTPAFDAIFSAYRGNKPKSKRMSRKELVEYFTGELTPRIAKRMHSPFAGARR